MSAAPPSTCPRCGESIADQEFYGVCGQCTLVLRTLYDGTSRGDLESVEYEPKMNVTPNAVALKE